MGFGTELTPLLFLLGYTSLQFVTILFLSEAITGCFVIIISVIFTYATFDLPTCISYIYVLKNPSGQTDTTDLNKDESTENNNDNGTPGFEFLALIAAFAAIFFIVKKKN